MVVALISFMFLFCFVPNIECFSSFFFVFQFSAYKRVRACSAAPFSFSPPYYRKLKMYSEFIITFITERVESKERNTCKPTQGTAS